MEPVIRDPFSLIDIRLRARLRGVIRDNDASIFHGIFFSPHHYRHSSRPHSLPIAECRKHSKILKKTGDRLYQPRYRQCTAKLKISWSLAKRCPISVRSSIPWSSLSMQLEADKTTIYDHLCHAECVWELRRLERDLREYFLWFSAMIVRKKVIFLLKTRSNRKLELVNKFENISWIFSLLPSNQ